MTDSQTQSEATAATTSKPKTQKARPTKVGALLTLLRSKRGVSIEQLQQASGWQPHSVRGFLSGTVRKKLGLTLISDIGKDGLKRYRIEQDASVK